MASVPKSRLVVLTIVMIGFIGLPLLRQVLGIRAVPAIQWQMYAGKNADVCTMQATDATGRSIDWPATLGRKSDALWPLTPLITRRNASRTVRQLCDRREGDVRVHLRCAHKVDGWSEWHSLDESPCEDVKRKAKRRGRRG